MFSAALTLEKLKERVPINTVRLDKGLMSELKQRAQRLFGFCPVHGADNPQAFVVDYSRNLWCCSTRCQGAGDVVELMRRLEHTAYRQIRIDSMAMVGTLPRQHFVWSWCSVPAGSCVWLSCISPP